MVFRRVVLRAIFIDAKSNELKGEPPGESVTEPTSNFNTDDEVTTAGADEPIAATMPAKKSTQSSTTSPEPTTTARSDAKKVFKKFMI
jgi:hypothetical protein